MGGKQTRLEKDLSEKKKKRRRIKGEQGTKGWGGETEKRERANFLARKPI